jgi:hypothetical protein
MTQNPIVKPGAVANWVNVKWGARGNEVMVSMCINYLV